MIHLRSAPRDPVDPELFNETYLMHCTTSPSYPIIASLDVAAGMMRGPGGRHLLHEAITEAVRFRQAMVQLAEQVRQSHDRPSWFFGVWQPDHLAHTSIEQLSGDPGYWTLRPGEAWHGFTDLEDDYCLLDPIKVTITCPGVHTDGSADDAGIPAKIVAAYLERRDIVVEKTGDYTLLVLFSLGTTKGKWGTLVDALVDFKHAYDNGDLIEDFIPGLGLTGKLHTACNRMHSTIRDMRLGDLLDQVFTDLPTPLHTPAESHSRLVHGRVERVRLDELAGRTAASLVVVTPPGIPMLMPGEQTGPADGPLIAYLNALQTLDRAFPTLASETHGIHRDDTGTYRLNCTRDDEP